MADWLTFRITAMCSCPPDRKILLPLGTPELGKVVVDAAGKRLIMPAGVRVDHGEGACVPASLFPLLGGRDAEIRVRHASALDIVRHEPGVLVQAFVTSSVFIGAVLTALAAFNTAREGDDTSVFAIAAFLLFSAVVGATWKFVNDLKTE